MAYEHVNGEWPAEVPALTFEEGVRATKKLCRKFMKRKCRWSFKKTSGRNWGGGPRGGVWAINPTPRHQGGWWVLVHNLSHRFAYALHPGAKPHSPQHHFLEKEMVAHVVRAGWLDGRLRPRPPKARRAPPTPRERAAARLARWEAKERRAAKAVAKLKRTLARLDRAASRAVAGTPG